MKEVKAYINSNRIGSVIAALKDSIAWVTAGSDDHNLTAYMVKGLFLQQGQGERHYSLALEDEVVNEYKLELHCEESHVEEVIAIICAAGRTGHSNAGWIYVTDIDSATPIA